MEIHSRYSEKEVSLVYRALHGFFAKSKELTMFHSCSSDQLCSDGKSCGDEDTSRLLNTTVFQVRMLKAAFVDAKVP